MQSLDILQRNCKEVIDILPINILIINKDLIVTYVNTTFKSTFGKDYIKTLERGPGDLLSCVNSKLTEKGCGHSEKCKLCSLRIFLKDIILNPSASSSVDVQMSLLGDFGVEKKWFKIQVIPLTDDLGERYITTMSDISVYKHSSYQLLEHKKLAEAANRAKSEFLANMSHEIRTPLNGIIGMIELTLLTKLNEEQSENLEVAKNCADALLALINDVLDLSKVESNKVTLEERQFDIRDLLQKVGDTQTAKLLDKDLEFKCIVEDKIPPYLYGDAFRLQQVLINLLSNAVKFTEGGNVTLEAKQLCYAGDSSTIVFSVEDTGIGISSKEMNTLFKPFSQVDGSITRKYGGTGLGLAISQSLVNLMGGEIKVKSQKEKGSVFYFTIQMKAGNEIQKEPESKIFATEKEIENLILVVEDDKANQMVIRQMLNKMGYTRIDVASTGFEALKLFEQKSYSLILMDIQLPELDGIGTTHIIREKEKKTNSHIPIIALTAHALKGDRENFLKKGMDGYVAKPINPKLLSAALEETLKDTISQKKESDLKEAYASWNNKETLEPSDKGITQSDKRLFKTMLSEMEELLAKQKGADAYIQLEKKAHELKVKAQRKEYDALKTQAFRLELSSRKKDFSAITKIIHKIKSLLNEKTNTVL